MTIIVHTYTLTLFTADKYSRLSLVGMPLLNDGVIGGPPKKEAPLFFSCAVRISPPPTCSLDDPSLVGGAEWELREIRIESWHMLGSARSLPERG